MAGCSEGPWQKPTRVYNQKTIKEALRNDEEFKRQFQNQRREKELAEVRQKLGEKLLDGDKVLLIIQEISMVVGTNRAQKKVITFFDPGSTCSLVLTNYAEENGLEGTPVTITIGTVNGEKERTTKLYVVELLTTGGERKIVRAFGMEKISEEIPFISFNGVKHLFSNEVQKEWERVTSRPVGAIELLVGAEVASIFPDKFETKGELVVMKSAFGSGYTMFGTHPELRVEGVQFSKEVKMVRQMRMKVTTQYNHRLTHNFHVSAPNLFCTAPPNPVRVAYNYSDRFMEAEGLGVEPPRRCFDC